MPDSPYEPGGEEYAQIPRLSTRTEENRSIFYSGYFAEYDRTNPERNLPNSNRRIAERYRDEQRKSGLRFSTIEDTPRGKTLLRLEGRREEAIRERQSERLEAAGALPTRGELDKLWDHASRDFARNASGNVRTYVVGARARDTFRGTEQKALVLQRTLLSNPAVTSINGVPREQLARVHREDENRAFYHISRSEVERDRREVKLGESPSGVDYRIADRMRWHRRTASQRGEVENPSEFSLIAEEKVMSQRDLAGILENLRGRASEYGELRSGEKEVEALRAEAAEARRAAEEGRGSAVAELSARQRQERLERQAQALSGSVRPGRLDALAASAAEYERALSGRHGVGALGHALSYQGPQRETTGQGFSGEASGKGPEPLSRGEASTIRSMLERGRGRRSQSTRR